MDEKEVKSEKEQAPAKEVKSKVEEIPAAEHIFDFGMADAWLGNSTLRLESVFRRVRFEPAYMRPDQIEFCLFMAGRSIVFDWKDRRGSGRGVLYVPKKLADQPVLSYLERGDVIGDYVAFHRKAE